MKSSVVEFKLFDEHYCFNADIVEYIFDLEEYNRLNSIYPSVIGLVKHNFDVMLLIDTAKLYSNKELDFNKEKSVIVIKDEEGHKYAMVVDEVVKLDEYEMVVPSVELSSEEVIIRHYKDSNRIINEIYPINLIKKAKIAPFSPLDINETQKSKKDFKNVKNLLLFEIDKTLYAIETKFVKEVLQKSTKEFELSSQSKIRATIPIRDRIVAIASLKKPTSSETDLIITKINKELVAFEADCVYDIEQVKIDRITQDSEQNEIFGFYNYKSKVVAIINVEFYFKKRQNEQEAKVEKNEDSLNKLEYLLFKVGGKKFCISMKYVRQVVDSESLNKTDSSSIIKNPNVSFIATWNHQAIEVLDLKNILNISSSRSDFETIFIEIDKNCIGFMVDEIENIAYLEKNQVSIANDDKNIIGGAIIYKDEPILSLNEKFLINLG